MVPRRKGDRRNLEIPVPIPFTAGGTKENSEMTVLLALHLQLRNMLIVTYVMELLLILGGRRESIYLDYYAALNRAFRVCA